MNKGQAFLTLMFLVGGLILATGIALIYIAASSVNAGYGFQAAESAQAVATAGAEDALIQLDRNASFAYASPGYTVSVSTGNATVIVTQNAPSSGLATITSQATVSGRTRKVQVVVSINTTTSQVTLVSWQDIQ